jgi:predicted PurR-regulated permease PerM
VSPDRQGRPEGPLAPRWLRAASEWTWRSLLVGIGVVALLYALGYLRVVVLPIIVAVLFTTLLLPPARWLRRRGFPDAAAAATAMVGAVLVLAAIATAVAPSIGGQVNDLGDQAQDGVREATRVLADKPFNLSRSELNARVDEGLARVRENSDSITHGVTAGAVLLGEALTGLIVSVLLTFFFLKDGAQIWGWLVALLARGREAEANELGARVFTALSGYVRGIALVGLVDALLIGLALVIVGVPLVVPLMILTFLAAFVPLIGAFVAGLIAVLIALVSNGVVAALIILGAILLVQQVEGHVLYPVLMSRTVHLHPVVIVLALAVGGVAAGIIGVFLAVPTAGVISTVLDFARNRPQPVPALAEGEP